MPLRSVNILLQPFLVTALMVIGVITEGRAQFSAPNVSWEMLTPTVGGAPGEVVRIRIRAVVVDGHHIYSMQRYGPDAPGPLPMDVAVGDTSLLRPAGVPETDPQPIARRDANFDNLETEYWEGTVVFILPVQISPTAPPGNHEGVVGFEFMTCNSDACFPPTERELSLTVSVAEQP